VFLTVLIVSGVFSAINPEKNSLAVWLIVFEFSVVGVTGRPGYGALADFDIIDETAFVSGAIWVSEESRALGQCIDKVAFNCGFVGESFESSALHDVMNEGARVGRPIREGDKALPVEFVFEDLSRKLASVRPAFATTSRDLIIYELTIVFSAIGPSKFT